jgi:hypothetical protein
MYMPTRTQTSFRTPDWAPLERALKAELGAEASDMTSAFWFVGFVDGPADVGELRVYQHSGSRRELTLDIDGRAYRYFAEMDGYGSLGAHSPLMSALAGTE